jgi:Ca2+-transporting ATPase
MKRTEKPWADEPESVLKGLETTSEGLTTSEVQKRRRQYGPNRLREAETRSAWSILIEQFKSLIVLLLFAAAALSFVLGEWVDGAAILAVILINAAIGFLTELRAVRSMEALQQMVSVETRVRRDGQEHRIKAESLVPGDIVIAEGGDVVTADIRLFEASRLQVNESSLTGESVPVRKSLDRLPADVPLAERSNMLFKGTHVTQGASKGVVVATGMETELGHISELVQEAEAEFTPLEKRLDKLGRRLVWATLVILLVVTGVGILRGKEALLMFETGVALAVAAIPEGLPIVATIALARGMMRMANRNALINQLAAVETLGSTNVICTDKTGTLTENQMTVIEMQIPAGEFSLSGRGSEPEGDFTQDGQRIDPAENRALRQALRAGVLCNNASLDHEGEAVGDPVEAALLVAGAKAGLNRDWLLDQLPETREVAFDPDVKMMATFHEENDHYLIAVKGAPESVLDASVYELGSEQATELTQADREAWQERGQTMARNGLRVLALADKTSSEKDADPYQELRFLGLAGLLDPPREDVRSSIDKCHQAGVRVIMITGDHPETARKVALAVGLIEDENASVLRGQDLVDLNGQDEEHVLESPILARVTPKQKLDLIGAHQQSGAVVAMTGDGVNDAPALKKSDIGIAMGQRGTQVAQEAADMVLQDDAFLTIVEAIAQGRIIFENIRKFVLYLLSCNISEIMTVFLATLIDTPLPIQPLQILYLNLVTDVFPALALGVGEGDPAIMDRSPRDPKEPILTRRHWSSISIYGLLITVVTLAALMLAMQWLGKTQGEAVTISFLTLAFAQLWHVFNMGNRGRPIWRNEITRNPYIWMALALCTLLLLAATYLPLLSGVLGTVPPGLDGWLLVAGFSLAPLTCGQILKSISLARSILE